MFGLPIFPTPNNVAVQLLNRLLKHQPWGLQHLRPHGGKSVVLKIGTTQLHLSILDSGYVQSCNNTNTEANVTLILPSENLSKLGDVIGSNDPSQISNLMQIQGDAGLAQVVSDLARDLRWDFEHSLASRIGDIPALALIKAFKTSTKIIGNTGNNLAVNISEFISEESQIMANQQEFHSFKQRLNQLSAKINQLETTLNNSPNSGKA